MHPPDRAPPTELPTGRTRWAVALPVAAYAVLGLAAYFPAWPGDPGRIPQCACADAGMNAWFLAAAAHAVAHGHNLFYTTALNYPFGVNLTYNTQMPLLGLVATPLTLAAGPVSSLNLWMYLALPLSATSLFLVLCRWTSWLPAAFTGGLLYGFSPYMVGQSTAHLNLTFVPIPPLILWAVVELFVRRTGNPRRLGMLLGVLAAGQFLISSEVLVTTALVVVVGLAVLAVARPGQVLPSLRFAVGGMMGGLVVVVALLAYPTWMYFGGPGHVTASAGPGGGFLLRSDLLSPFVPTSFERFAPGRLAAYGDGLTAFRDYSENGAYLSVPVVLLLVYVVARTWASRWIRLATAMAVITFVLSLGSPLNVGGHSTGIPLPAALLEHVPLVEQLLPSRIALFTALFVGIIGALGIDELHRAARSRRTNPVGNRSGPTTTARRARWAAVVVVAAVGALALVPRWPNRTVPVGTPSYFLSGDVDRIPSGTVALTYPYAAPLHAEPMVWQAATGLRFSLIGGYAFVPDARGVPTLFPSPLQPAAVQKFFINEQGGVPFYDSTPGVDHATLVADVGEFVHRYGVGVVLVDRKAPNAGRVAHVLSDALGRTPVTQGGVEAWYLTEQTPSVSTVSP